MLKVCLKSLQEDAADDINRRHFQMQVFLAFQGLIYKFLLYQPKKHQEKNVKFNPEYACHEIGYASIAKFPFVSFKGKRFDISCERSAIPIGKYIEK